MTVDEAKKKWCPILNKAQTCPCFCAADMCMAWRWSNTVDGFENRVLGETISGELIYGPVRCKLPSTTDGYCGLIAQDVRESTGAF